MSATVITPRGIRRPTRALSHPMVTVAIGFFIMATMLIVATVAH
jgi:hypothetical protein